MAGQNPFLESAPQESSKNQNENPRVRGQAAFLLGEIGDLRSIAALQLFSSFEDQFISEMSLIALTTLINSWTIEALRLKLKDPDPEIRSAAAIALNEKNAFDSEKSGNAPSGENAYQ